MSKICGWRVRYGLEPIGEIGHLIPTGCRFKVRQRHDKTVRVFVTHGGKAREYVIVRKTLDGEWELLEQARNERG